eukprot:g16083.t1
MQHPEGSTARIGLQMLRSASLPPGYGFEFDRFLRRVVLRHAAGVVIHGQPMLVSCDCDDEFDAELRYHYYTFHEFGRLVTGRQRASKSLMSSDKILKNKKAGLHTLCLLDIKVKEQTVENLMRGRKIYEPPRFMTVRQALDQLCKVEKDRAAQEKDCISHSFSSQMQPEFMFDPSIWRHQHTCKREPSVFKGAQEPKYSFMGIALGDFEHSRIHLPSAFWFSEDIRWPRCQDIAEWLRANDLKTGLGFCVPLRQAPPLGISSHLTSSPSQSEADDEQLFSPGSAARFPTTK